MQWVIDNNKPIYIQLVDQLKTKIISGDFKPGDKINSVRTLAQEAEVNPNTMQKALTELERQGLVFSKRTSGRFVTDNEEMIKSMKKEVASEQIKNLKSILEKLGFTEDEMLQLIISNFKGGKSDV